MATLIIIVLSGLLMAYFATQNTASISLNFLHYTIPGIPVYVVVAVSLLVGLFLSWIISLVNDIATGFTLWGKESKIKSSAKENAQLAKEVHDLELENTKLKAEKNSSNDKSS